MLRYILKNLSKYYAQYNVSIEKCHGNTVFTGSLQTGWCRMCGQSRRLNCFSQILHGKEKEKGFCFTKMSEAKVENLLEKVESGERMNE